AMPSDTIERFRVCAKGHEGVRHRPYGRIADRFRLADRLHLADGALWDADRADSETWDADRADSETGRRKRGYMISFCSVRSASASCGRRSTGGHAVALTRIRR